MRLQLWLVCDIEMVDAGCGRHVDVFQPAFEAACLAHRFAPAIFLEIIIVQFLNICWCCSGIGGRQRCHVAHLKAVSLEYSCNLDDRVGTPGMANENNRALTPVFALIFKNRRNNCIPLTVAIDARLDATLGKPLGDIIQ